MRPSDSQGPLTPVPKPVTSRDGAYVAWVRGQPCLVCGKLGEACHVRTRRNGGDRGNVVPLCREHHREQHQTGIQTFQARYHLDLAARARALDERYQLTVI